MDSDTKKRKSDFSLYKNNDFLFKEKERINIRWIIISIISYLLFAESLNPTSNKLIIVLSLVVAIGYCVASTVRYFLVNVYKKPIKANLFLCLDIILISSTLFIIPNKSGLLNTIILFLVISTGMNYGYKAMLKSNSLILTLFTCAVIFNEYWQENMTATFSFYLTILLIPFYLTSIIKNIEMNAYSLNERAYKDFLTGLYNRTTVYPKLEKIVENTIKTKVMSAVFYFDLDNFKKVNDVLGHKMGDALLVAVAAKLKRTFRNKDLIFRLGGDEFLVLAEGLWKKHDAEIVAQKILEAVSDAVDQLGISIKVSSSIGIMCLNPDEVVGVKDIKSYVTLADKAMYDAKKAGKSQYVFAN
jgi:diguanylate cyclase (GGDEF)-like protein